MPAYDTLIRIDFLAAVGLLVLVPLFLLVVSLSRPRVRDRLLAYWRASALLGITVYLWIGELAIGFGTGVAARALIPVALWWGDGLTRYPGPSEPATDQWQGTLFRGWRWIASVYCIGGVLCTLPLLACVWDPSSAVCSAWYRPPQEYAQLVHPYTPWSTLVTYGKAGLAVYIVYGAATAYRFGSRDPLHPGPGNGPDTP